MTGPDPRRAAVCQRTRGAVAELILALLAGPRVGPTAMQRLFEEFPALPNGGGTVEQLAVALDMLGYDLVLTATAQDTPAESEAV